MPNARGPLTLVGEFVWDVKLEQAIFECGIVPVDLPKMIPCFLYVNVFKWLGAIVGPSLKRKYKLHGCLGRPDILLTLTHLSRGSMDFLIMVFPRYDFSKMKTLTSLSMMSWMPEING